MDSRQEWLIAHARANQRDSGFVGHFALTLGFCRTSRAGTAIWHD